MRRRVAFGLTAPSALIEGLKGVAAGGGSTVTNFGTILTTSAVALRFTDSTGVLIVEAGCAFDGEVLGNGGTLDLGSGVGTVSSLFTGGDVTVSGSMAPTTFQNFSSLEVASGATFTDTGAVTIAVGQTVIDAGVLTLGASGKGGGVTNAGLIETTGSGMLTLAGSVTNTGTLSTGGGTLLVTGAVTGKGVATISGATLDFASSFTENVTFTGTTGILELAQSQGYTGTISGFSKSGKTSLDLLDIAFGGSTKATYAGNSKSGVLTVTDGAHTAMINLKGNYTGSTFNVASDGRGGTLVTDPKAKGAAALAITAPAALHAFVAAASAMGSGESAVSHVMPLAHVSPSWSLTAPRACLA